MPEKISIEECVRYGIDFVLGLTQEGPFFGDVVSELSEELMSVHPSIDGKVDKIAKSVYWVLFNRTDSPLESFFWADVYNHSTYSLKPKFVKRDGVFDRNNLTRIVVDRYSSYILS